MLFVHDDVFDCDALKVAGSVGVGAVVLIAGIFLVVLGSVLEIGAAGNGVVATLRIDDDAVEVFPVVFHTAHNSYYVEDETVKMFHDTVVHYLMGLQFVTHIADEKS